MTEPLRVRVTDERQAEALARELRDLVGFDLQQRDGTWEVTIDGAPGDKLVVRFLNAVRSALDGDSTATAVVLLNGREYQLDAK